MTLLVRLSFRSIYHALLRSPLPKNLTHFSSQQHKQKDVGCSEIFTPGKDYLLKFTCNICQSSSVKRFSKHAYYKGVVIVKCPGCNKLHLVADRLGWFEETNSVGLEEIMRSKGTQLVRKAIDEDVCHAEDLLEGFFLSSSEEAKKKNE